MKRLSSSLILTATATAVTICTIDAFVTHPVGSACSPTRARGTNHRIPTVPMPMRNLDASASCSLLSKTPTISRTQLHLAAGNNDKEPKDNNKQVEKEDADADAKFSVTIPKKLSSVWKVVLTKFMKFFPAFRIAVASFTVGAIFALTVVFVPVYNSVDKMSEPVTLFETILTVSYT